MKAISFRFSTIRIYAVVSLILIIVGAVIIGYSFSASMNGTSNSQPSAPVSLNSPQWAGYVAMSNLLLRESEVTIVTGSWDVPAINPTANDTYSSVWVGIGGFGEGTLIQAGTAQQSVNGVANYYAWYEFLPNRAVRIQDFTVFPSDKITTSIKLVDSNANKWTIEISDLTRGTSFSENFLYNSSRLSAEWIVEAPSINGVITSLANFGSVTFTGCFATISGTTGTITSFPGYQLVMHNNQDVQLVNVSPLTSEGTSFNVTYSKTTNL